MPLAQTEDLVVMPGLEPGIQKTLGLPGQALAMTMNQTNVPLHWRSC
jgi:hypothetical protein